MISIFSLIGATVIYGTIIYLIYKVLHGMWSCWLGSKFGFGFEWRGNNNTWAIVTGASRGLGLEFARNMAKKGYAVLLISRSIEKLNEAKESIEKEIPNCRLRVLPLDLSLTDNYLHIQEVLRELDNIEVLINNCGKSYVYPEYLNDIPFGNYVIDSIININVYATTKMIQLILPKMVARNRGLIINVSSISAIWPLPLLAVYSASKIYVDYLSRALSIEYASKGITIQCLTPGYCKTDMAKIRNTSIAVPSASKYVKSSLKTPGIEIKTNGYWFHKVLGYFINLNQFLGQYFMILWLKNVRKRYFKKMERDMLKKLSSTKNINQQIMKDCDNKVY
jgi:17beta-estradiol 17-dehydrogenase / very-long-chain 3-oxoacyl-CoA reductase